MLAKLTKRTVDSIVPAADDVFVWDTELKGFGFKVTPQGRRVFVVQYRSPTVPGVRRKVTLGAYGVLTPDQARDAALVVLGRVAKGEDPAGESAERRAGNRNETVASVGKDYLADVKAKLKATTAGEYKRMFEKYVVPAIGFLPIAAVTFKDVSALHNAHQKKPYQANRILQMLKAFFYWAELHGHRAANANPCRDVKKFPEQSSERFMTVAEVRRLGEALDIAARVGLPPAPQHRKHAKSPKTQKLRPKSADTPIPANPFAIAAIRFLLLTGWREQEALTLRRGAIDFERGFATRADTKTGKSHRPIGAPALELIKSLPEIEGSPFVFPGSKPEKPLKEIKRVWYAVRHAATLDDVRLHDLRHTVASFSVVSGHSLYLTGKLLGHSRPETTQRYAHLADDARRIAANAVSTSIAEALRPPDAGSAA
jgi:integrase